MFLSILSGLIGIALLTAYCLLGALAAPQIAYWMMTPKVKDMLEEAGIRRKFERKNIVLLTVLTLIILAGFAAVIWYAGKQGAESGMSLFQLTMRFLIFWWMVTIFDAVVLDWWMFTKTRVFGILVKQKTGKEPPAWSVEPQWDGKEIYKLIAEAVLSVIMAWIFLRIYSRT